MRKELLFILIFALSLASCEKKTHIDYPECLDQFGEFEPNNKPGDGQVELIVYDRSDLAIVEYENNISVEKVAGNRLVFKYIYVFDDEPNIADDEYSEVIWFAVKTNGDSFELHTDDFEDSGASFGRLCFCADGGFHRIIDGCIFGQRTGEGKWEVSIAIQSETNFDTYTRMIQGDFLASF